MPKNRPPRIFVSHSHKDNDFGMRLIADLRAAMGEDEAVWYDVSGGLRGGDAWWRTIVTELSSRSAFLVILSPDAMASPWVNDEIDLAWKQKNSPEGKAIVPVLYRACQVREDLQTRQIVSFLPPKPYEAALAELFAALGLPAPRSTPVPAPVPASMPIAAPAEATPGLIGIRVRRPLPSGMGSNGPLLCVSARLPKRGAVPPKTTGALAAGRAVSACGEPGRPAVRHGSVQQEGLPRERGNPPPSGVGRMSTPFLQRVGGFASQVRQGAAGFDVSRPLGETRASSLASHNRSRCASQRRHMRQLVAYRCVTSRS